ncbi:MAG TPA: VanZ family protein [Azospira sp.]|nr:VanZ family protein [Azospira sp.]
MNARSPQAHPLLLLLAGAIVALLLGLGGQPVAAGLIPAPWDKAAHFVVYATIAALLRFGIGGRHPWRLVTVVAVIGCLDEWRQMAVPGRSADLADLATDILAAAFAIAAGEWWTTLRRARRTVPAPTSRQARKPTHKPTHKPAHDTPG